MDKLRKALALGALVLTLCLWPLAGAQAAVSITTGPTPVIGGDGQAPGDITLRNEHLAITLAVETAAPWGVARGGIIDGAVMVDGKPGLDRVTLVDFIPNNWSAWPTTYQKVTVVKDTPEEGVIKTERDWEKCQLVTVYTLRAGEDRVHMLTTMVNQDQKDYADLLSGYVLWTNGGHLFSPAGLTEKKQEAKGALTKFAAAYDRDWTVALHAPYFNFINYHGRDMYLAQTLKPGQSQVFEGWLQFRPDGDLSAVVAAESAREKMPTGKLGGKVATVDGQTVETPVVVVEKNGVPYTWAIGSQGAYQCELPVGDYQVYATAAGHAPSAKVDIKVAQDTPIVQEFADLRAPGKVAFDVVRQGDQRPLDARVTIVEGEMPVVGFLGAKTFFTELGWNGHVAIPLAPGKYVFGVAAGAPFFSQSAKVELEVASGQTQKAQVAVDQVNAPGAGGWYSADLHHHSNLLDGVTPPEFVIRSQLAAAVDYTFISDHDLLTNLVELQKLSERREVTFIPGVEISPSWGHFNAYPVRPGESLRIDPGTADVHQVFAEARRLGARVLAVNHPFITYGYFYSLDNDKAPGGWNPGFNLVELNAAGKIKNTVPKVYELWNQGHVYYLTAGTDVHDVWKDVSGSIRMFVHQDGQPSLDKFLDGLLAGHSYASQGPLVEPDIMFGNRVMLAKGATLPLTFRLRAAEGLKDVALISQGQEVEKKTLEGDQAEVTFQVAPGERAWYSLVVQDAKENKAWTNPIWVDVVEYTKTAKK